ncbi:MAG: F0F1 ATP synthase subunit alpha [Eubacteriales bacterium]
MLNSGKNDAGGTLRATLIGSVAPDDTQAKRFTSFLEEKYGRPVELIFSLDENIKRGFVLKVGEDVYDWTAKGILSQFDNKLDSIREMGGTSVIPLIRDSLADWTPTPLAGQVGTVISVGDGIATVGGLEEATYGEILLFPSGVRGMVQDLSRDRIGCILFGGEDGVDSGAQVRRTGRTAGVPVGEAFLGRVVDALGAPIDGSGEIKADAYRPVERSAPAILDRQPVDSPMETGILAIDALFPIGKGQRELIIGDRQTGKSSIALDVILNQKGKNTVCIYVAIGQKAGSVAQTVENLRSRGAMDYTVVVNAPASDSASLQYIAPYAGCAIGEYFMEKGRDVLIVYDDLSKHAVAYRTISLLLGRSPGREAYPGDVFYLHSRLLERSARLSESLGGGSMTALPIVETQAGDVSAYIPTNIISITDGQIFLESNLFFAGQRPAVNVGLSVSRVGGDAQTKALKSAVGTLRLDLSQYREMEVFTQFSSDLDELTKKQLAYGQSLMYLLRQSRYSPYTHFEEIVLLTAALGHIMQDIPPTKTARFIRGLLEYTELNAPELHSEISPGEKLSENTREKIINTARKYRDTLTYL